jgi:WD40 repeat protein
LLQLSGHTDEVWSVAFAPDGKTLLATSKDKTIRFWRAATDADGQARRGQ